MRPHAINERLLLIALLLVTANLRPALASLGPVLESLRTDLQLSHTAVGMLNSVPIICMGVCAPLALWLQRCFGLRSGILSMTLLLAIAIAVRLHASVSMQFLSAWLLGISIAALGPLLAGFIKQYFVNSARISAWSTTSFCISASLGASLSAWLSTRWSWPATLAIFSVPVWLSAVLWWFAAPADAPAQTFTDPHSPVISPRRSPWRQWRGWMLLLCFGTNTLVFFALLAWLPALFSDMRVSAVTSGYLLGWFALVQIIAPLGIGMIAKPQQDRRMLLWLFGLCLLAGLMGLYLMPLNLTLAWLALAGMGTSGLFTLTMMLALDFSEDARSSASWMAMISTGGYLIAALGPWLFGALREHTGHYHTSLQLLIAVTGVALLSCYWLTPIRHSSASTVH